MTMPGTAGVPPKEPVLRPVIIDMSVTAERVLTPVGEPIYSIFIDFLAAGTTSFEIKVGDQFIPALQGDTVYMGDCNPTLRGLTVRTQPALAGLFSRVIVGGTPDSAIERG